MAVLAVALPFIAPAAHLFGFVAMPMPLLATLMAIVLGYVAVTEAAKHWCWRRSSH
jgi:hypothetical protein